MPTVYVETTIPSYLAAFRSRDLVTAANQQITHEWWSTARQRFEYGVDYLVTWNCAHIANGQVIKRLLSVNKAEGLVTPLIVTPQELQYS